ncbi:PCNA-interacting partner isoform X1 [Latimeria chalumnae]|uniref:PCNA-interacting partner isoform X1 n=1 Tax=Latimeria chalumnae TaxID=7897 RepID=UPI00313EAD9C
MDVLQQSVLTLVKLFRRELYRLCDSERITVCGAGDMLLVLQLSIAEVNKEHHGEFSVSLSDLVITWNYLLKDKLELQPKDGRKPEKYDNVRKAYEAFLKNSNIVDLIDVHRMCMKLPSESKIGELPSSEQILDFLSGATDSSKEKDDTLSVVPSTPIPSHQQNLAKSKLQSMVKRLICGYLNLLVNTKNDLALACILNVPDRGLGRDAFTDLKYAARSKQMSLFLAATSFIRIIELGGKGYAPSESDPLRKYIKGLSDLVHFIDKLEEILGEVSDPSVAGGRILSAIKMRLLKGQNSGDPFYVASEEAVQILGQKIKNIINFQCEAVGTSPTGISPSRPKTNAINHDTAYCGRPTIKALIVLLDEEIASPPSENKVGMLYEAEENTAVNGTTCILTLFRTPEQSSGSSPKSLKHRVQKRIDEGKSKVKQNLIRSQFACTYKEDTVLTKKLQEFPSFSQVPTCLHPAPKQDPAICFDDELFIENLDPTVKRPALGTTSGNVQQKGNVSKKDTGKMSGQPGNKSLKRKQVDINGKNVCDNENEPPQKKTVIGPSTSNKPQNKLNGKPAAPRKGNNAAAKKKLIPGQAKLTSFFRV